METYTKFIPAGLRGSITLVILLSFSSLTQAQISDSIQNNINQIDSSLWNIDLSDIVVTAQYAPTHSKNAVHKIKTINLETIEARGVTTLDNLLQQELNIRIGQDMILGSSITMQGIGGQNVKIMIDGVPVIGRVGANIDLSQISLRNIERVEIIEGPMSVNFGTNALGGVINLISKKSQLKKYEFNVNSKYESVSNFDLGLGFGVRIIPKLLFKLHANYHNFNGFNYKESSELEEKFKRTFVWNPKENRHIGGMLRWQFGEDGSLMFRSNYFIEHVENKGLKRRLSYKPYAFDETYTTSRYDNTLKYSTTLLDNYYLNTTVALNKYTRYKLRKRIDFEDNKITDLHKEQDSIYYNSYVIRPVLASKYKDSQLNFQFGLDLNFEEAIGKKIKDTLFHREHYSAIGDYAVFTSLNYAPIDELVVQAGLRYAHNTKFQSPLTPSINFKYNISKKLIIRLSFAKGFRAPTIKELFYYFVDTNHYIVGNDELNAEVSNNFQCSLDWEIWNNKQHKLGLSLSSFYSDIQDKIDLYSYNIVDGNKVPDPTSTLYTYFNQDRFKSIGSNIGLKYQFKKIKASFGLAPTGRYNINAIELDDIPEFTYFIESNLELGYTMQKLGLNLNLYLKHNDKSLFYFADEDKEGNEFTNYTTREGFTLADLSVTKRLLKDRIKITGGIKDLFDVRQIGVIKGNNTGGHGSSQSSNISTGRNWFMAIKIMLN